MIMKKQYLVKSIDNHPSYTLLRLIPADDKALEFQSGQYIALSVNSSGKSPVRCFSITSAPGQTELEVAFRRDGQSTKWLANIRQGATAEVYGPYGEFVLDGAGPVALLSGGIGITPFVSMMRSQNSAPSSQRIAMLASARRKTDIPFVDELQSIARSNRAMTVDVFTVENDPSTLQGRIDENTILQLVSAMPATTTYYVCGSSDFTESVTASLYAANVSDDYIQSESFASVSRSTAGKKSKLVVWATSAALGFGVTALLIISAIRGLETSQASSSASTATTTTSDTSEATADDDEAADTSDSTNSSTADTTSSTSTSTSTTENSSATTTTNSSSTQRYSQPSSGTYTSPSSSAS